MFTQPQCLFYQMQILIDQNASEFLFQITLACNDSHVMLRDVMIEVTVKNSFFFKDREHCRVLRKKSMKELQISNFIVRAI